jgi:hypothetical protein
MVAFFDTGGAVFRPDGSFRRFFARRLRPRAV